MRPEKQAPAFECRGLTFICILCVFQICRVGVFGKKAINIIHISCVFQICRVIVFGRKSPIFIHILCVFIPPATKLGGVYWNHHVRLSVSPSVPVAFGFPAHNCFPFTPIIMKLHMQTPHELRMCPIDFEVKRSKVKVTMHKLLKMVSSA